MVCHLKCGLRWRTMRKPLFFLVLFLCVSFVLAQKESSLGAYILTGGEISEGISENELRFVDEEVDDIPFTITAPPDEFKIDLEGVRGTMNDAGHVHGTAEVDGAYLSVYKTVTAEPMVYEFYKGTTFDYSIPDEKLTIASGKIILQERKVGLPDGALIVGDTLFPLSGPLGNFYIDDIGHVTLFEGSSFELRSDGILFSGGAYVEMDEEQLTLAGDVLVANEKFSDQNYKGAYIERDETALRVKNTEGNKIRYLAKDGNTVVDARNNELFQLVLADGGDVYVQNREKDGLIPLVEVVDQVGLQINTGYSGYKEGIISSNPPTSLQTKEDLYKALAIPPAVPLVIEDDSGKYVFSPGGGFAIYKGDKDKALFQYNDLGIPITEVFTDNNIRTIDDLFKKWRGDVDFFLLASSPEYTPSQTAIQVADYWMSTHYTEELISGNFARFAFSPEFGSSMSTSEGDTVFIEDALYSIPSNKEVIQHFFGGDREIINYPLGIITHENTHLAIEGIGPTVASDYESIASAASQSIERDERFKKLQDYIDNFVRNNPSFRESYEESKKTDTLSEAASGTEDVVGSLARFCNLNFRSAPMDKCRGMIELLAEDYGLPAAYGLDFVELPATWSEEPLQQRIERANSANPRQRETYRKLAKLAYDSHQIAKEECKAILGGLTGECTKDLAQKGKIVIVKEP